MDAKRGDRVDRRKRKIPVALERRLGEPSQQPPLRRATYPGTVTVAIYEEDEREFLLAMQQFKERTGRRFPTWSDVLRVVKSLGYVKRVNYETDGV